MADGVLYEGTGLNGRSSIRRVELETGAVLQGRALPRQFFGEGVTVLGNRIFQLTWRSGVGFVYDRDTFALLRTFAYPAEGWGLTTDGARLIASDGTATLRFLDPETLKEQRRLEVVDRSGPVAGLNELEYVEGSDLCQCLADRAHRHHRCPERPGDRLAGPERPARRGGALPARGCPERHRL